MKYTYSIEDGQFSTELNHKELLGNEGDVVHFNFDDHRIEAYILYIKGNFVQCIGNVENSYPKDSLKHNELKEWFLSLYPEEEYEYAISFFDENDILSDKIVVIETTSEEKARKQFYDDYPLYRIYQVD